MNRILLLFLAGCFSLSLSAQELAANQNPNFAISRAKYMKVADSLTRWHSTTSQETYKAIDYLADKQEFRNTRRQFRRALRMERARNSGYYDDYSYPYYNNSGWYNGYSSRPYYNRWSNPVVWNSVRSPFFWYWLLR